MTAFFFLLLCTSHADVRPLVQDLVAKRAELESLSREVESLQKEKQAELDLWLQKKLELESAAQKEKLRRLQIDEKLTRLERGIGGESKGGPVSSIEVRKWIERARDWVKTSLPFRQEARLATLSALHARAESGESPELLLSELWSFYETELKMAGETEYRIQDRTELARLGWVALFSRMADGPVQRTALEGNGWVTSKLTGTEEKEALRLMDNSKARKKAGLYKLTIPGLAEYLR